MVIKIFHILTCLKCDHEFRSNQDTKRPKCSKCGSTSVILSKNIPANIKFEKDVAGLKEEMGKLKLENIYLKDILNNFIEMQKEKNTNHENFEIKAIHTIKDLLFWKQVLKDRTEPKEKTLSKPTANQNLELAPIPTISRPLTAHQELKRRIDLIE